jgi:hypothetical protein
MKASAYPGSFRKSIDRERISASKMKIAPTRMLAAVVMIRLVLITFPLFSEEMKRIMEKSKPSLEKRMTRLSEEIRAVARPTCSTVYKRAAIIQKKKPQPALKTLLKAMKKEFLYRGSLASTAIALKFEKLI